jgi:hypothetical protein
LPSSELSDSSHSADYRARQSLPQGVVAQRIRAG